MQKEKADIRQRELKGSRIAEYQLFIKFHHLVQQESLVRRHEV